MPVPQRWQEVVEVARLVPHEREQQVNEEMVTVPVSLILGAVDQGNTFGCVSDGTEDIG